MCYLRETVIRVCLPLLGMASALCLFAGPVRSADPPSGLKASAASTVHPVLIRNDHGLLLRIVVELAEPQDVRVKAISFTLDGTDDLADIESLTLYSTDDKEEFSSDVRFGEPAAPGGTISFQGESSLRPGRNVFWLCCRLKSYGKLAASRRSRVFYH